MRHNNATVPLAAAAPRKAGPCRRRLSPLGIDIGMSIAIALTVTFGVGWVAYATLNNYTHDIASSSPLIYGSTGEMWWGVMRRNLPVFLGLVSGVATFGLGSLLTASSTALFVGATLSVTSSSIGWSELAGNSMIYAIPEFVALTIAAVAGLLPTVSVTRSALLISDRPNYLKLYLHRSSTALIVTGCAAVLLAIAAYVEALMMGGNLR